MKINQKNKYGNNKANVGNVSENIVTKRVIRRYKREGFFWGITIGVIAHFIFEFLIKPIFVK